MAKATRVHSTPRRTASKIQSKKCVKKSNLAANAAELKAIDGGLSRMHIEYGDDADSRQDYLKLAARRRELLQIFGSTPALSQSDIEAKALALSQRATLEDYRNTALIAKSLANDILTAGAKLERFPLDVNLFVHRGFPNCGKSDSVFATIRCEDDHGKGIFDRLERSFGGFGRGRRELPGSRAPA
jgi:hypothetical protein